MYSGPRGPGFSSFRSIPGAKRNVPQCSGQGRDALRHDIQRRKCECRRGVLFAAVESARMKTYGEDSSGHASGRRAATGKRTA
jgi:hypothetical protein